MTSVSLTFADCRTTNLNDFWRIVESRIIVEGVVYCLIRERLPQNTVVGVEADEKDAYVCQRTQVKRGEKQDEIEGEEHKTLDNKESLVVNFCENEGPYTPSRNPTADSTAACLYPIILIICVYTSGRLGCVKRCFPI